MYASTHSNNRSVGYSVERIGDADVSKGFVNIS